jgi:hypothetical protein
MDGVRWENAFGVMRLWFDSENSEMMGGAWLPNR